MKSVKYYPWIVLLLIGGSSTKEVKNKFLINTVGCNITASDTFDPEIMKTLYKRPYKRCGERKEIYTELYYDDRFGTYNLSKTFPDKPLLDCTYKEISRMYKDGGEVPTYGDSVIFEKWAIIPKEIENIYVECILNYTENVYQNVYALVRDKRKFNVHIKNPVSILIMGIDSLSSGTLMRTMPKTWAHLESSKRWFHFPGYNKVCIFDFLKFYSNFHF